MRRASLVLAALSASLLVACDGASSDLGLGARMRVEGAQFVPGSPPAGGSGPAVVSIDLSSNQIRAGQIGKPLSAALDPAATAAAIGLQGDLGYWVVPAGLPEVQAPGFPTFHADLSFASDLAAGEYTLDVRASDVEGRFGPPQLLPLSASGAPAATGALVISLRWDTEADLDLHVVDPAGVEIYKRNINSYEAPPPGQPVDPTAWQKGAILDLDSNAACVIDGRRQENVIWKDTAPPGHYLVRVDTFSLCGEASANWAVEVRKAGAVLARAEGQSGPTDEQMPHDRGAGVLALDVDVP
jgi:hypothetical protein